jgi:hypothetical protein
LWNTWIRSSSTKWICVERISLDECILNAGHDFYTWQNRTNKESDALTYVHRGALSRRNF